MATLRYMFVCLCNFFLVYSEIQSEISTESHDSKIAAVLHHLNSQPFKVYNYRQATLLNAQKKSDVTELSLDVQVDCTNTYPDVPCTEKTLTCSAFVQTSPEGASQVLSDVNCKPKPEIIVEDVFYNDNPTDVAVNKTKSIALSNEAVSSEVGEPFVAIRKDSIPCLGCPFDLSVNAEGVDELIDIALEHVGSERDRRQALVEVLKVQQQVTSGVKYFLLVEIAPTVCSKDATLGSCPRDTTLDSSVCSVVFLQKPWISRIKHVISNNCTVSQEYVKPDAKRFDLNNEIDSNDYQRHNLPNFDDIAASGTAEQMTPLRLSDLESQILDFFPNEGGILTTTEQASEDQSKRDASSEETTRDSPDEDNNTRRSEESELKQASNSSEENSSEENAREKRAIPQLEKITPDEKGLVRNLADFAATALDNIDDDNHRRIILQILGAKKMVGDDGVYYHLIMRMGISRCLEDKAPNPYENCREKLIENYTKVCKVQVYVSDDFSTPKIVKSQCQNIKKDKNDSNRTNYSRFRRSLGRVGGQSEIDKDSENIRELVRLGVNHLNARHRNVTRYQPKEVISATSQVVAGFLYRINATVMAYYGQNGTKPLTEGAALLTCQIKVWEKSWENFRQFTISCDDGDTFDVQTTISRRKRSIIPGPSFQIATDFKNVKGFLEDSLTRLDRASSIDNKYKIQEVVAADVLKASNYIYRITAKIVETECKKSESIERYLCRAKSGSLPKTCHFLIDPLFPNGAHFNTTCKNEGGLFEKHLESGMERLDEQSVYENKFKVVSIVNQTVTGDAHYITAKVVLSDCEKGERRERATCGTAKGAEPQICRFTVFEALSRPSVDVTCDHEPKGLLGNDDRTVQLSLFTDFLKKYKKEYASKEEFKRRFKVFTDNLLRIRLLNTYELGTAWYGVSKFADLTPEEFSKSLGLRTDLKNENDPPFAQAKIPDVVLPTQFDWRQKGAVTEVKNQEQCGSCWAFSVTGNVEGQYAIKHGNLLEFSEQELVDCDTEDQGCNGGLMDTAYRQIEKLGGLETEQEYPYEARDEKCHFNKNFTKVQLTGALNISHNETDMAKWLVAHGPISIAINANAMQFYMGGVSHPLQFLCSPKNLDHGVLIVGYGVHTYPLFKKTLPYWIVKNSWGTSWGEQGYYRVYRGDGTCGLNQTPSSAIVA